MEWMIYIFFGAIGAVVGSFLNVVVLRYNTGRSSIIGRSSCFSCGKELHWYELIPVLSFLFLKGRCGSCKSKVSWQYAVVEIITASLFVLSYRTFGLSLSLVPVLVLISASIVIAVYDFRHKMIPLAPLIWLYASAICFASIKVYSVGSGWSQVLWLLLGGIAFAAPYAIIFAVSKGRAMGFGDVELGLSLGFLLGLYGSLNAVILSFYYGAFFSVILMVGGYLLRKLNVRVGQVKMKSAIPFGPFIIAAALTVLFFGTDILGFYFIID